MGVQVASLRRQVGEAEVQLARVAKLLRIVDPDGWFKPGTAAAERAKARQQAANGGGGAGQGAGQVFGRGGGRGWGGGAGKEAAPGVCVCVCEREGGGHGVVVWHHRGGEGAQGTLGRCGRCGRVVAVVKPGGTRLAPTWGRACMRWWWWCEEGLPAGGVCGMPLTPKLQCRRQPVQCCVLPPTPSFPVRTRPHL